LEQLAAGALSEEDEATQSLLKCFAPASSGIDRDRLMFLAGRAAGLAEAARPQPSPTSRTNGRHAWVWPAATAVMSAVSLLLAIALFVRPASSIADRDGAPPAPAHNQPPPQLPQADGARVVVDSPSPVEGERVASDMRPRAASSDAVQSAGSRTRSYLRQREIALTHGIDALPESPAPAASVAGAALPQRELLEELLPGGARQASGSGPFGEFFSWPSFHHSEDNL
jgi:hypothetical protein